MASVIRSDNSRVDLPNLSYDAETTTFVLTDGTGDLQYPFVYQLPVIQEADNYLIFLFYKKDVRNQDIFPVFDRESGQRLGWIFPVTALTSIEHSFVSNEHFLKVAFRAYELLLAQIQFEETEETSDDYFDKLAFLHSDTVILCLSASALDQGLPNFQISHFNPFLYNLGFTVRPSEDPSTYWGEINPNAVRIRRISGCLETESFINELFDSLIYEKHPLLRFHVLYQVIEICLDKILLKELELLTKGVKEKHIYGLEIRKKFEGFESEKGRINKLFNEYYPERNDQLLAHLRTASRLFLTAIGRVIDSNSSFADHFYLVRNAIVHDYRNTGAGREHLDTINEILPHVICDLLLKFAEDRPVGQPAQQETGEEALEFVPVASGHEPEEGDSSPSLITGDN